MHSDECTTCSLRGGCPHIDEPTNWLVDEDGCEYLRAYVLKEMGEKVAYVELSEPGSLGEDDPRGCETCSLRGKCDYQNSPPNWYDDDIGCSYFFEIFLKQKGEQIKFV